MSTRELDEACVRCAQLRQMVVRHAGGQADAEALRKLQRRCQKVIAAADDAVCEKQLERVARYAQLLLSGKGSDVLRREILHQLESVRSRIIVLGAIRHPEADRRLGEVL